MILDDTSRKMNWAHNLIEGSEMSTLVPIQGLEGTTGNISMSAQEARSLSLAKCKARQGRTSSRRAHSRRREVQHSWIPLTTPR